MADVEKITIASAIEHFKGEVYSARIWLDRYAYGKPKDRRADHNIAEFEQKLRMRQWVVDQLTASLPRKDGN